MLVVGGARVRGGPRDRRDTRVAEAEPACGRRDTRVAEAEPACGRRDTRVAEAEPACGRNDTRVAEAEPACGRRDTRVAEASPTAFSRALAMPTRCAPVTIAAGVAMMPGPEQYATERSG